MSAYNAPSKAREGGAHEQIHDGDETTQSAWPPRQPFETLNGLHKFLSIANEGQLRRGEEEAQINQVACLNLVSNAVIAWNSVYIRAALEQLRAEGLAIDEADVARLSPARFEHINPYGKFHFDVKRRARAGRLRPLRRPS